MLVFIIFVNEKCTIHKNYIKMNILRNLRKPLVVTTIVAAMIVSNVNGQNNRNRMFRENVPTVELWLSDPAVLADPATQMYYMTGSGGMQYRSTDLKTWSGPYNVIDPEPILPGDFGHAMLFKDLSGKWFMSVHSNKNLPGSGDRKERHPYFFEVDLSGDKLVVKY